MTNLRLKYNLGKYEEEDSEKLVEGFSEKTYEAPINQGCSATARQSLITCRSLLAIIYCP